MVGGQRAFLTYLVMSICSKQMKRQGELLRRDTNEGSSLFPKFPLLKPSGDLFVTLLELLSGVEITFETMSEQPLFVKF